MKRIRSTRIRSRLARRFVLRQRGLSAVLALTALVCVAAVSTVRQYAATVIERDRAEEIVKLGAVSLWLENDGRRLWLTDSDVNTIREQLRTDNVAVSAVIRLDGFVKSDPWTPVTVIGRPAWPAGRNTELMVVVPTQSGPRFVELEARHEVHHMHATTYVIVNADQLGSAIREWIPENTVGNAVEVSSSDGRAPGVVAFDSAELVSARFESVSTWSIDDRGVPASPLVPLRYLNGVLAAFLATVVIMVVSVGFESQGGDLALLTTLGLNVSDLRAILIRQTAGLCAVGSAGGVLAAWITAMLHDGIVVSFSSLLLPPLLFVAFAVAASYLTVRSVTINRLDDVFTELNR